MKAIQSDLFVPEATRLQMTDSIALTLQGLNVYMEGRDVVSIASSGGKDSTLVLTLVVWAILTRQVPIPKQLVIMYADTRMELLPLYQVIDGVLTELEDRREELAALGCELVIRRVMAKVDRRFFVQLLGRGVPPSHNKFRWCTPKLKLEPMAEALAELRASGPKPLLLHGVRIGESAARDGRIALACSKEDSECGQGWYQEEIDDAVCDKFGPILHWRVCHVAEWLQYFATRPEYGDWDTALLVRAYGGEEAMEAGARTGCVGCPLVTEDRALNRVCALPEWRYLSPLKELRDLYTRLRGPTMRLRKPMGELRKDGQPVSKQQRLGPLTMAARLWALDRVLQLQAEVNTAALAQRRPTLDLLNAEEEARIRELIAANTWPAKWDGTEPVGDRALMTLFERTREQTEADLEGDDGEE